MICSRIGSCPSPVFGNRVLRELVSNYYLSYANARKDLNKPAARIKSSYRKKQYSLQITT